LSFSQNYSPLGEVDKVCLERGFATNEDAEIEDHNLLSQIVVFSNFTFQKCPDINAEEVKVKN
jgi:hypothetical protein